MSLKEKLSAISKDLQETKLKTEAEIQEKSLEPLRLHIKKLESEKNKLEVVFNSLELKSSEKNIGKGIREYSKETENNIKKETADLDSLLKENKEALQSLGVEDRDQLIKNPEFSNDSEVIKYKKALEQDKDLKTSDAFLYERLKTLGVTVDLGNFTYDSAFAALKEKIKEVENELLKEKLQTPEGKEEISDEIAKKFETDLEYPSISEDDKTYWKTINFWPKNGKISFFKDEIKFVGWKNQKSVDEINILEKTYGSEVPLKALKKAYENKIQEAFIDFDTKTQNLDEELKIDLERSDPKKWSDVSKKINEFKELQQVLENTLQEKSEAFKKNNIEFSPTRNSKYGGEYKKYAAFTENNWDNEVISETINNPDLYPPKLNFDALQEYIEKRIIHIKEFIESVKKLETEEDINNFSKGETEGVGQAHHNILYTKFDEVRRPQYSASEGSWNQTKVRGLMKFNSYNEAKTYFEQKAHERKNTKEKILGAIITSVEADLKYQELKKEIKDQELDIGGYDIDKEIELVERNKKSALVVLSDLMKLESELPKEMVNLKGEKIQIPSVSEKLKQLEINISIENKNLDTLKESIKKHESKEPKYLGVKKWKQDLEEMESQKKELEEKIRKMSQDEYFKLNKEQYFKIPVEGSLEVESIVKNQNNVEGLPNVIFENLKSKLNKVIDKKIPESVIKLYREYKDLVNKIS